MNGSNWKFPDALAGDDYMKISLNIDAVVAQMVALEEDATRDAVIDWLRGHGYAVIEPGDRAGSNRSCRGAL